MSRSALVKLLVAQTVLLVLAVWVGVYFARDEYLLAVSRNTTDDDDIVRANAVSDQQGVPTVRLSAAAQRNVGLEVAMPEAGQLGSEAAVAVVVLDAQPLAEAQGRLRAARHELDAARAQAAASAAEHKRVQALYDDDRNASQRALETAAAQAGADAAKLRGAEAALATLRESLVAGWGATLARELESDRGGLIARLASGREVLLRALLRADAGEAPNGRSALALAGRRGLAQPLGAAGPAAGGGESGGRSLLFRAEGGGLLPGQRLSGQLRDPGGKPVAGVLVPASALVWHAGQPWIYVRESNTPQDVSPALANAPAVTASAAPRGKDDDDDDRPAPRAAAAASGAALASAPAAASADATESFQRRAVPHARRVGDRWFLPGWAEDDPVVVRGAQVLLSEEQKSLIRNENDD